MKAQTLACMQTYKFKHRSVPVFYTCEDLLPLLHPFLVVQYGIIGHQ